VMNPQDLAKPHARSAVCSSLFGSPPHDISALGFGSVNSPVNDPSMVQFALKLTF